MFYVPEQKKERKEKGLPSNTSLFLEQSSYGWSRGLKFSPHPSYIIP